MQVRTSVTVNAEVLVQAGQVGRAIADVTYQPWVRRRREGPDSHTKYGPFLVHRSTTVTRQLRPASRPTQYVDAVSTPSKPIVWYFDKGFPETYKSIFYTGPERDATTKPTLTPQGGRRTQRRSISARRTTQVICAPDFKRVPRRTVAARSPVRTATSRYNFLRWACRPGPPRTAASPGSRSARASTRAPVRSSTSGIESQRLRGQRATTPQRIDAFLISRSARAKVSAKPAPTRTSSRSGAWSDPPPGKVRVLHQRRRSVPVVAAQQRRAAQRERPRSSRKMQQYLALHGPDREERSTSARQGLRGSRPTKPTRTSSTRITSRWHSVRTSSPTPRLQPLRHPRRWQSGVFGPGLHLAGRSVEETDLPAGRRLDRVAEQRTATTGRRSPTSRASVASTNAVATSPTSMRDGSRAPTSRSRTSSNSHARHNRTARWTFDGLPSRSRRVIARDARHCVLAPVR